jgi:hypothetical protein
MLEMQYFPFFFVDRIMKLPLQYLLCSVLTLLVFSSGSAQVIEKLNAEIKYGVIIPHSEELQAFATNPLGIQLSYSQLSMEKDAWEICNCFFDWGVQLSYHNFNNPAVLGHALSASTFFEPILIKGKAGSFSLRNGIGVSYLNRVYHEENNPQNTFFSAPISFLLYVQPRYNFPISENLDGNISLIFNHISNGGQSQPNRGMNYPMLGAGVTYYLNKRQDFPDFQRTKIKQRRVFYSELFATQRKSEFREGRDWVLGVGLGGYQVLTGWNALGLGGEFARDQSLGQTSDLMDGFIAAPFVSHHFLFGRFEFAQRFAYYASRPEGYTDSNFFQRYIIQYRVWEGLHFGASLKSHGHVAENIDLRLQWKF